MAAAPRIAMFRALTIEWSEGGRAPLAWLGGVLAVTAAAHASALALSFTGDDFLILRVLENSGGLADPGAYFRLAFFGYYRPLTFLSHAIDWTIWGQRPFGYHLTSLVLHLANTALVFLVARRLLAPLGAVAAALLFALHPSNEEAVFWMAARFDLLAAFWGLLCLWLRTRTNALWPLAIAFGLALLSKESAFSFLLILGLYDLVLCSLGGAPFARRLVVPVVVALAYVVLRAAAAEPEAAAGLAHYEKVGVLATGLAALLALGLVDWRQHLERLGRARHWPWLVAGGAIVVVAAGAILPATAAFVRAKLAFAAFAAFYLVSPVVDFGVPPSWHPAATGYWVGGLAAVAAALLVAVACRRALADHRETLFAVGFVLAALVPVSSMTEGRRYLYLASVGMALVAGRLVFASASRSRRAIAVVALVMPLLLAVSIWQIQSKAGDWAWAGRMTGEAIALVGRHSGGECVGKDVVVLAAPVDVRDVYSHLYRDTFLGPGGCGPRSFRTLLRAVGHDQFIEASWDDARTIALRVPEYAGHFVASTDLRRFDRPLAPATPRTLDTPIGQLQFAPAGRAAHVRLRLSDPASPRDTEYFYFSLGAIRYLPAPRR